MSATCVSLLALFWTCAGLAADSGGNLQVSISVDMWPSTAGDVAYGTTVILTCSVSGDDVNNTTFEWNCPNGPCNTSTGQSNFIRRVRDSRLTVTVVDPGDIGVYNCTVTVDSRNMLTGSVSYELRSNGGLALYSVTSTNRAKSFIPSNSVLRDTDLLVESEGKYRIACRTAPGAAQWYFPDGSAVPEDSNGHVHQLSHGNTGLAELYIAASSILDRSFTAGLYSCYAVGQMRGYIGLYLNESANLYSQSLLEDVDISSGKIVLKPKYYWDPSASYIACCVRSDWGIRLPPLCTQGNQSAIVLSGLDVGGTYGIEVWAVSGAGVTGGTAKAQVHLKGDPLHLFVSAARSTNITVEWTPSTQGLYFTSSAVPTDVYLNTSHGFLTLKSLAELTSYSFSFKPCSACSNVTFCPITILNNPTSVSLSGSYNGTALLLSSSWSSVPTAVLYRVWWYLGAELISLSTTEDFPLSLPVIDYGTQCNYRVVVAGIDVYGRTGENRTAEVSLDIAKPFAPPTPKARVLSDTKILVIWEPAVKSCARPISTYQVRAAPKGTENYTSCSLNTTTGPPFMAVCENLSRGTLYEVDIVALGPMGNTTSTNITASTFDIPSAPQHLTVLAMSASVVNLLWLPPASDGGTPIIHYLVTIQDTQMTFTTVNTYFTVRNLMPGIYYVISVKAVNVVGESSSAQSSVILVAPSPPTNLTSLETTPTSIFLIWVPPAYSGHPRVTAYRVMYREGDSYSHKWTSKTSLNITGLQPGTNYTFKVYAKNSVGLSQPVTITVQTSVNVEPPGLPKGPIAGGTVAAAVLLCLVAVAVTICRYCVRRRRKRMKTKKEDQEILISVANSSSERPELEEEVDCSRDSVDKAEETASCSEEGLEEGALPPLKEATHL